MSNLDWLMNAGPVSHTLFLMGKLWGCDQKSTSHIVTTLFLYKWNVSNTRRERTDRNHLLLLVVNMVMTPLASRPIHPSQSRQIFGFIDNNAHICQNKYQALAGYNNGGGMEMTTM